LSPLTELIVGTTIIMTFWLLARISEKDTFSHNTAWIGGVIVTLIFIMLDMVKLHELGAL